MTAVLQTSNVGTYVSAKAKNTPSLGGSSSSSSDFSCYGVTANTKDNWRARSNARPKVVTRRKLYASD